MIMKMCWNLEPTERPAFSKISRMIERILGVQDEQEKVCEMIKNTQHNMWGCGQNAPWQSSTSLVYQKWCFFFFLEKAQSDFQQLIFRNVQPEQVTEGEGCDEPKCSDRPCDQSCDHEEEEEPLMKTNNYQFCWVRPKTGKPIWLVNKQWESWISRGTADRTPSGPQDSCSYFLFLFCFVCLSFFFSCLSAGQTSCCRTNMWPATLYSVTAICHATKRGPTERTRGDKSHKHPKLPCFRYLSSFQNTYTYTSLLHFV